MHSFLETLQKEHIDCKKDILLSSISTFRVGGTADVVAYPDTEEKLIAAIDTAESEGVPYRVIGNTSNLLFSDDGYRGFIIITKKLTDTDIYDIDGQHKGVRAAAGVMLPALSERAARNSLSGFEFACGIPGTVGGAVFMNAGAHGETIADILVKSRAYDKNLGRIVTLDAKDHGFDYRHSVYKDKADLVCLSAEFILSLDKEESIRERMHELREKRRLTQPLELPSAGSFFKRPDGYFAAKLIQDCGLKGTRVGDAEVSTKHSGFIVNLGKATAKDILELSDIVREKVKDMTGVSLEREVIFVE